MIIPSILAFTFLGLSSYLNSSFTRITTDQQITLPIATWLTNVGSQFHGQDEVLEYVWGNDVLLASLAITMTVNALATGLIVFRIFMVFRQSRVTSDDQVFGVTRETKFRSIIFVLIESGLLLFSIQLARLVVSILTTDGAEDAFYLFAAIHQQLNVIRRLVIPTFYFTDNLAWLGNNTYNHPGAGLHGIIFPRPEFAGRSCRKFALCA